MKRFAFGALTGASAYSIYQQSLPDPVMVAEECRKRTLKNNEVVAFATLTSPVCHKIFHYMTYHNIPYSIQRVSQPRRRELMFSPNHKSVPVALIQGRLVEGSNNILRVLEHLATHPKAPPPKDTGSFASFESLPAFKNKSDEQALQQLDATVLPALQRAIFSSSTAATSMFSAAGESPLRARFLGFIGPRFMKDYFATSDPTVAADSGERSPLDASVKKLLETRGRSSFLGGSKPSVADFALYGVLDVSRDVPDVSGLDEDQSFKTWKRNVLRALNEGAK